jgi:hypothetical protein
MAKFDPQKLVMGLIGAVESTVGVPPFYRFVLDNLIFPSILGDWIFPSTPTDLFAQFQDRVALMIDRKLEVAVGQATFNRVASELNALALAFQGFAEVVDVEERKRRLTSLVTQADVVFSGIQSVPPRYLAQIADTILVIATIHLAALLDEVQHHPERYEHQIALNEAAIRYSDLAGATRDRFLWYRMSQIAEGIGLVTATEVRRNTVQTEEKQVTFYALDDMYDWQEKVYGVRQICTPQLVTGWIPVEGMTQDYYDKQAQTAANIVAYADAEKQKVYEWWDTHLTSYTQKFMDLVDWQGRQSGRKPRDRMLLRAYPRTPSADPSATLLQRIDLFLGQQMDQFVTSGPRYVQTYRVPGDLSRSVVGNMLTRADSYDTAVAAIYFTVRGDLRRAADLADGLCTALEHDAIGGGRIVAATQADRLIDPEESYATSVFVYDGATRDVGNACWAGLALTRLYARTGNYRYLHNALAIGRWLVGECAVADAWQGFSGGEDNWANKRLWRSVEHNVDAFALFNNLYSLTGDAAWQTAAESARTLVRACRTVSGYYVTGTGTTQVLNDGVIPTDVQTWTTLADIDPAHASASLSFMLAQLTATDATFAGFRFSLAGTGVQNEVTAGAAMALMHAGGDLAKAADAYLESLTRQQTTAPGADGLGVVATPATEAYTGDGLGWKYFNWPHVASTAWTGLAMLYRDDASANPYAPVKPPSAS